MSYVCVCQRSVPSLSVSHLQCYCLILILIYYVPINTVVYHVCSASHMYPEDIARYSTVVQLNL